MLPPTLRLRALEPRRPNHEYASAVWWGASMTALAVSHAAIRSASDTDREAKLMAYLTNAHQIATAATDVTSRYHVVRDVQALNAMAKAFRLSDEAARKLGETSILCLRLFGLALREIYPGESNADNRLRSEITGASPGACQHASAIASYSEDDVLAAFEAVRERELPAAFKYVYAALRDNNPRVSKARARRAVVNVVGDPDRASIDKIWKKVGCNHITACREILRLSREVVALKAQLKERAG